MVKCLSPGYSCRLLDGFEINQLDSVSNEIDTDRSMSKCSTLIDNEYKMLCGVGLARMCWDEGDEMMRMAL